MSRSAVPDPEAPAALAASGLALRWPKADRPAFGPLDLRLGPGERLLLAGPSGCGKSSLLATLSGLVPAVLHGSVAGNLVGPGRGGTGLHGTATLFQDPETQTCRGSVHDEVAFGMENAGLSPEAVRARVPAALGAVGLAGIDGRRDPHGLSGGETQRLILASLLATDPSLLLLDEPMASLDPAAAEGVRSAVLAWWGAGPGRAFIAVDHDLERWAGAVDRVVLLDGGGRIAAEGPLEAIVAGPWLGRLGLAQPAGRALAVAFGWAAVPLGPAATADAVRRHMAGLPADGRRRAAAAILDLLASAAPAGGGARPIPLAPIRNDRLDLPRLPDLPAGRITAILGRSGAGKSSLIDALAGQLRRRGIAVVPQRPALALGGETVTACVADQRGVDPAAAEALLRRVGLADQGEASPFRLSLGQQRRLALVRAMARRPEVLLVDEPLAGLDAASGAAVTALLRAAAGEGAAVVLATHDADHAAREAGLLLLLAEGRLVVAGDAALLEDETTLRHAGLVHTARGAAAAWAREMLDDDLAA